MNDLIKAGLTYLTNITPDQWQGMGTAVLASGVLSPTLLALKKFFSVTKDWLMFGIVVASCFAVVGIAYLKGGITVNPIYATAIFTVLTNIVYYAIIKPLKKTLLPLAAQKWVEAKLYKEQKQVQSQLTKSEEDVPGRVLPQDFSN